MTTIYPRWTDFDETLAEVEGHEIAYRTTDGKMVFKKPAKQTKVLKMDKTSVRKRELMQQLRDSRRAKGLNAHGKPRRNLPQQP
mgnify:CR=1 FL=1